MSPGFILVVEDDPSVASVITETLQAMWSADDVDYFTVSSLTDAADVIQNFKVDMIILDLTLPDSNQEQTLPKIIELCRGRLEIVVLVLSGGITMVDGYKAMVMGADDFIMKGAVSEHGGSTIKHLTHIAMTAWTRHLGFLKRVSMEAETFFDQIPAC